jgi:hypothetical protein
VYFGTRCVISFPLLLYKNQRPASASSARTPPPAPSACLLRRGQRAASSKQRMSLYPLLPYLCIPPPASICPNPSNPLSHNLLSNSTTQTHRPRPAKPQHEPPDGVLPNAQPTHFWLRSVETGPGGLAAPPYRRPSKGPAPPTPPSASRNPQSRRPPCRSGAPCPRRPPRFALLFAAKGQSRAHRAPAGGAVPASAPGSLCSLLRCASTFFAQIVVRLDNQKRKCGGGS